MILARNRIFLIFFITYFVITIFQVFFLYFIPLYYLDVLKVDPKDLALTQIFPYLPLFISPLFGYLYDKYITRESQSKILLNLCFIVLVGSLFIFIFYKESIILFGIFTFLSTFSIFLIRTIMSNLYLHIVEENPSNKRKLILILRMTIILAYVLTSILFQTIILQVSFLDLWNIFFLSSFSLIIVLIILNIAINSKTQLLYHKCEFDTSCQNNSINKNNYVMLVIYIAFFLGSSDLLFLYLFSSWILNKFGEIPFKIYSSLLVIFPIGELLGNLVAYKYDTKKCNNGNEVDKRKIMFVGIITYMFLMSILTYSNFFMILILNFGLYFTGSIANFAYVSFITDLSKKEKYKTSKFQFLQTYNSLASMIFVPLSYLFYSFIKVELLIITSVTLFGFSGAIILTTYYFERILYKNEIQSVNPSFGQHNVSD